MPKTIRKMTALSLLTLIIFDGWRPHVRTHSQWEAKTKLHANMPQGD